MRYLIAFCWSSKVNSSGFFPIITARCRIEIRYFSISIILSLSVGICIICFTNLVSLNFPKRGGDDQFFHLSMIFRRCTPYLSCRVSHTVWLIQGYSWREIFPVFVQFVTIFCGFLNAKEFSSLGKWNNSWSWFHSIKNSDPFRCCA